MTDATAPRQARPRGTAWRSAPSRSRARSALGDRAVRYCLGPGLIRAMRGATGNIERYVPELNALNVYPVPDGDTGVNMIATMRAALAEVEAIPPGRATLSDLAAAISFGALMGARGNSGVILSQVFRGMAESVFGKRRANATDLAEALTAGTRTAYGAVARPVEGTILTVAREAAHAATEAAARGEPLEVVLAIATEAARSAVGRTPDQLAVLREAGVVDAGGQGLYRALEGALATLTMTVDAATSADAGRPRAAALADTGRPRDVADKPPHRSPSEVRGAAPRRQRPEDVGGGPSGQPGGVDSSGLVPGHVPEGPDGTWGYETVFLLHGRDALAPERIRERLEAIGESVLVAGDARMVKVHVHNDRPDAVIALGLSLGSLSQVAVQNLDQQTREFHLQASTARVGETASRPLAVLAVAAGEGLAAVFASFGVERIVQAQREGKPSTGELLEALRSIDAPAVIVLPNDPNVVLAAEHAARECPDKDVVIVPTRSAPEGFAALLAMDPTVTAQANLEPMLAAAHQVRTFLVGMADRPSRVGERTVRPGQFVVLSPDEGVVEVADDPLQAIGEVVARLDPGFEIITVYRGEGATTEEAERIVGLVAERRPGTEVEVLPGGQPHYRYLISVE